MLSGRSCMYVCREHDLINTNHHNWQEVKDRMVQDRIPDNIFKYTPTDRRNVGRFQVDGGTSDSSSGRKM